MTDQEILTASAHALKAIDDITRLLTEAARTGRKFTVEYGGPRKELPPADGWRVMVQDGVTITITINGA